MFFRRMGKKDNFEKPARRLHGAATAQSRQPRFYQSMGAPDTIDGRFELLTLHVVLLLDRLEAQPALRQELFDTYVSDLDGALREMGVGDLSMGRRMKQLGQVFYGRARAFKAAFDALPDETLLREAIDRTVLQGAPGGDGAALTAYAIASRAVLAGCSDTDLLEGQARWAAP